MKRAGLTLAHLVISLFLGWHLSQAYLAFGPCHRLAIVDRLLLALVALIGNPELDNPNDMDTMAYVLYWVLASLAVAIIIGAVRLVLRRRYRPS